MLFWTMIGPAVMFANVPLAFFFQSAECTATASFVGYGADGFTRTDQARLRDVFAELDRRGCKLMLSNSDVPFIRDNVATILEGGREAFMQRKAKYEF